MDKPVGPKALAFERLNHMDWLLLLLGPIAAWLLFDINSWNQLGYADPWYYTGVGQAFHALVDSYSWPYYYIRFPIAFFNELFCSGDHPATGYILLRYLLVVLVGGTLYVMALRKFDRKAAQLTLLFVLCHPMLLRNMLWDYPQFLSFSMGLSGVAVWLTPGRKRWRRTTMAGALCALALFSNLFIATMLGMFGLSMLIACMIRKNGWLALLRDVSMAIIGVALVTLAGCAYLKYSHSTFDPALLWTVNMNALKAGNAYALGQTSSFMTWGTTATYVYVPFLMVISAWILHRPREGHPYHWELLLTGTCYCLFYLVYRSLVGNFVMEVFFYFAFLSLIVYLVIPLVFHELTSRKESPRQAFWITLVALLVPLYISILRNQGHLPASLGSLVTVNWVKLIIWIICAVGAIIYIRFAARNRLAMSVSIGAFLLVVQLLALLPESVRYVYANPYERNERISYQVAVEFARYYREHSRKGARILTWYDRSDGGYILYSASFVSLGDSLNEKWTDPAGLPSIGTFELGRLAESGNGRLIAMATNPDNIAKGKLNLSRVGVMCKVVDTRTIQVEDFKMVVEVIDYEKVGS
jgi:hypothetical protein